MDYTIIPLANRPDCIQACAAWAYGRWGVQKKDSSLDKTLNVFTQATQTDILPITFIAVDTNTNLPIAMGSLWEHDGDEWPEKTPWIAAIYTLYRYRNKGIARSIISHLEKTAKNLGYNMVYLKSGSAAAYYHKLSYTEVDTLKNNHTAAGKETLFQKTL